jgi:hypothetical protein
VDFASDIGKVTWAMSLGEKTQSNGNPDFDYTEMHAWREAPLPVAPPHGESGERRLPGEWKREREVTAKKKGGGCEGGNMR